MNDKTGHLINEIARLCQLEQETRCDLDTAIDWLANFTVSGPPTEQERIYVCALIDRMRAKYPFPRQARPSVYLSSEPSNP